MKLSATFINAVMDVRVEQGVFHFTLGEMVPNRSGQAEFVPSFRAAVPEGDAESLFDFLVNKARTPDITRAKESEKQERPNASGKVETSTPEGSRRKIPAGDSNPHGG